MEKLNKDEIISIAILLDFPDILNFCKTNRKIERAVCENNDFWRNKITQKFPEVDISNLTVDDWKDFYIDYSISKLPVEKDYLKYIDPEYIKEEFVYFLLEADFGIIPDSDIPLKYLVNKVAKQKVLTESIAYELLSYYLKKNGMDDPLFNKYIGKYVKMAEEDKNKRLKRIYISQPSTKFENCYSWFTYLFPYLFEQKPKFKKRFKKEILENLSRIALINYKRNLGKSLIW